MSEDFDLEFCYDFMSKKGNFWFIFKIYFLHNIK